MKQSDLFFLDALRFDWLEVHERFWKNCLILGREFMYRACPFPFCVYNILSGGTVSSEFWHIMKVALFIVVALFPSIFGFMESTFSEVIP